MPRERDADDERPDSAGNDRVRKGDDALALGIARGLSVAEACRDAGLGERTGRRRLEDRAFRRRVYELRGQIISTAVGRLAAGMTEAADVLRDLLGSETEKVRLDAAKAILTTGSALRTTAETELRMEEMLHEFETIERRIGELTNSA